MVYLAMFPIMRMTMTSCLMRMMIPAFPGAMRCAVAILGKGEATKVPITTMIGMAQMTQMTQMTLMRTGVSLPARAAV